MILLLLFALVAGAGTAISPCVLPVLPAVLSAGATGGRRRPLGVVTGLTVTYTVAVVALASLVRGVGLAAGATRTLAVVVLLAFGIALMVPRLADRLERPLARLGRLGPRSAGSGFWSGLGVGGALGFVYAPCAGPILAAVISVSATRGTSLQLVAVALAYAIGSALVLLILSLGGRRLLRHVGRGPRVQRAMGLVLALTAVAMVANLDVRVENALARHLPAFVVDPAHGLERSSAVQSRLRTLHGRQKFAAAGGGSAPASALPRLGAAPEFTGTQRWFNTPGGRPLSLASLHGRVVLVDFWTYTCINCLRTQPFVRALDERYRSSGLTVVGVHTPEFAFERDAGNVRSAVARNGLHYPVAQDNDYGTWQAYGNQYWPAEYLIDGAGQVRSTEFGEGGSAKTEASVRALLREAGAQRLPPPVTAQPERASAALATPETYLGTKRSERMVPRSPRNGTHRYPGFRGRLPLSRLALSGAWNVDGEAARAVQGAGLDLSFQARKVYLVLSSAGGRSRPVRLTLDGHAVKTHEQGADARGGTVRVASQRLYELLDLPGVERHRLSLRPAPGVSAYAFTFG
jgi:cytochrome c biogenesis protein CcdA/thiol-disulfide isomerase/thioredoxin